NTPIVTNLLYPNGKISIYYENNIFEISNTTVCGIRGFFQCKTAICPIHNSFEACRKATTSNVKCIWCEKWNTCIDSHHQDHHFFKVNDCHFKSPDVNDVSTSTPVNQNGTTFGIPEVQVGGNVKETTNGNEQYSSPDVNDVSTSTPVNQNGTTFGIPEVQVGGNVKET
uniref:Egg protein CP391S-like protein n=1 Tax=Schistosoma margrebowiei TaxID=48269 RepID=A0AA84ZBJ4_9TREM